MLKYPLLRRRRRRRRGSSVVRRGDRRRRRHEAAQLGRSGLAARRRRRRGRLQRQLPIVDLSHRGRLRSVYQSVRERNGKGNGRSHDIDVNQGPKSIVEVSGNSQNSNSVNRLALVYASDNLD